MYVCVCLDKPSPGIVHQGRTTSVCIECVCMYVCMYVCVIEDRQALTWDCSPGSDE